MAKAVIDELVTLFTLRSDKESGRAASGIRNKLIALKKMGMVAGAALTAAAGGVGFLLNKTNKSIDAQAKFAKTINATFENLQAFQFAGKKVGASVDEINGALENLSNTMDPAIPGEYNRNLKLLSVSSVDAAGKLRSPIAVMLDIANALRKLPKGKQLSMAKSLGLGPDMTRLLLTGSKSITAAMIKARKIGGVIPKQAADIAKKFDNTLIDLEATITGLKTTILIGLTPAITKTIAGWGKYIIANRKVIALKIKEFIDGASLGFKNFSSVITSIFSVVDKMAKKLGLLSGKGDGVKTMAIVVEGVLAGLTLAFVAANIEILLVVAAITALIALAPKIKTVFSNMVKVGKTVPDNIRRAAGLDNPRQREILGVDKKSRLALTNPGLFNFLRDPGKLKIPLGRATTTASTAVSNQTNAHATTQNITMNINGAGNPLSIANTVIAKIKSVATAVQTAHPGGNAPQVG